MKTIISILLVLFCSVASAKLTNHCENEAVMQTSKLLAIDLSANPLPLGAITVPNMSNTGFERDSYNISYSFIGKNGKPFFWGAYSYNIKLVKRVNRCIVKSFSRDFSSI